MNLKNTSIRTQLFAIVLIVAIPVAIQIVYSGMHLRNEAVSAATRETQKLIDTITTEQQNLSAGAEQLMAALALLPEGRQYDGPKIQPILSELLRINPQYSNLFLIQPGGAVWAAAKPVKEQLSVANRKFFKDAIATGGLSPGGYHRSAVTKRSAITLAYPYRNDEGKIAGVIAVELDFNRYNSTLPRLISSSDMCMMLADYQGTIIYRSKDSEAVAGKPACAEVIARIRDRNDKDSIISSGHDGIKKIWSYSKLRLQPGHEPYILVRAGIPYDIAISQANQNLLMDMSLLLPALFLAFICAWFVGKSSILDRITCLKEASTGVADGDYEIRVSELVSGGELGELGLIFDRMADYLQSREKSLRESERHYRSIFETSLFGIAVIDRGQVFVDVNDAFCKMLEYDAGELVERMKMADLIHPDDLAAATQVIDRIRCRETEQCTLEKRYVAKSGKVIDALVFVRANFAESGEYAGATASVLDITERKRNEELRREDVVLIENLLVHSPAGIRVFDTQTGQCILANNAAVEISGGTREAMLEQNFRLLQSWKDAGLLSVAEEVVADGVPRSVETILHTSFGKKLPVMYQLSRFLVRDRLNLLVIGRNMTEEKKLANEKKAIESQMLHAQKLESMGVLAGGIAHDFNNILTAIIGNADLALMRLNLESPVRENLHKIEQAAGRASDMARQMLAYSGKGKFVIESIDLNLLVQEMVHMLEVSISKKSLLRLSLNEPLPMIDGDATQLRQIVMNLVINASEAIGDKSGTIAITSGCMQCDRNYLKDVWLDENLQEGLYVFLEVADSGCGMSKETISRIFDPFFTTKFTGRGLGMAAVLGIVRGHKGAIKVYSEPGSGSSFKILLPAGARSATIFNLEVEDVEWKGAGTVLLVDDEETIRALGSEMLRELGFEVITAEDGRQAVDIFTEQKEVDLVILDLTMPHLDGEQTFRELRLIRPDVKVIMSSGYNEQEVTQKFLGKGLAGFIPKPYKLSTLKQVICRISLFDH